MTRSAVLVAGILLLAMGACIPASSTIPEPTTTAPPTLTTPPPSLPTPSALQTDTSTQTIDLQPPETPSTPATFAFSFSPATVPPTGIPTDTPTATLELQPSEIPSPTLTPASSCERETASVSLSAPAEGLKVGDIVKMTVTVNNEGCLALGLPQYRLYIRSDAPQAIFTPEKPEPVVHGLAVVPGQSDSAEFELIAVASGEVTLTGSVSYEVHLGYPGPAYWGYRETKPLVIAVAP